MAEILAPVGGKEQLLAAVRCGANAVYLGAKVYESWRNLPSLGSTYEYQRGRRYPSLF